MWIIVQYIRNNTNFHLKYGEKAHSLKIKPSKEKNMLWLSLKPINNITFINEPEKEKKLIISLKTLTVWPHWFMGTVPHFP